MFCTKKNQKIQKKLKNHKKRKKLLLLFEYLKKHKKTKKNPKNPKKFFLVCYILKLKKNCYIAFIILLRLLFCVCLFHAYVYNE